MLVTLDSAYTSGNIDEQVELQEFITKNIKQSNKSCHCAIGQDRNDQVGG